MEFFALFRIRNPLKSCRYFYFKKNRTNYYMGVETSAVSSGSSIAGKSLDGMLVGGLPEEGSFAPLSFKK